MFLKPTYVLSNELVQKMNIHIANISMFAKQMIEEDDYGTVIKMNNCTFINTKSHKLPQNILDGLLTNSFTDMSDKLPCTWVKDEFDVTEREWFKSGIVIDKVTIAGKKFYVFAPDFVKMMKRKIGYILDAQETKDCTEKNQILGSIQLGKNKFFTWY